MASGQRRVIRVQLIVGSLLTSVAVLGASSGFRASVAGAATCPNLGAVNRMGSWTIINPPDTTTVDPSNGNESSSGLFNDYAVSPLDPDVIYVVATAASYVGQGPKGYVYRTEDGGCTWKTVLTLDGTMSAVAVAGDPDQSVYVAYSGGSGAGGASSIYQIKRSVDDGNTWKDLSWTFEGAFVPVLQVSPS
ncbi:MAG: WD40/YVTN/BNR-like repeat-containing protein, partial [Acidimicrobiia bacterium]